MLNTDHLQTFVAVAETGSFTAAAMRLGFTQPAVSQQIKALETQVGEIRLFRRVGKKMQLTHAGEELLGHAREVLLLTVRAEEHMFSLRGHMIGRIGLGCAPTTGERMLPALLAAFRAQHSGVKFNVDVGPAERLLAWLGSGQVQAVLTDEHPRRRTFDVLELGGEPIACVVPRAHPLAQHDTIAWTTLAECPLIVPQRGMALRRTIEDGFRRHGAALAALEIVLETDSATVATQAAAAGLGLAFVAHQRTPKLRETITLALADPMPEQAWFLVRPRGSTNRVLEELWAFAASADTRKLWTKLGLHPPTVREAA